ncbi:MAG: acylphosphatase [Treponema sp.]
MKKIRQQLRFTGQVQGVGFRYTAFHLANELGITGWVYNDYDGSVLMQAQGTKDQISSLINSLQNGTFIQIDNIDRTEIPVELTERTFKIR